jgi:hypothetical protein
MAGTQPLPTEWLRARVKALGLDHLFPDIRE